jgi:hypothetical protein
LVGGCSASFQGQIYHNLSVFRKIVECLAHFDNDFDRSSFFFLLADGDTSLTLHSPSSLAGWKVSWWARSVFTPHVGCFVFFFD